MAFFSLIVPTRNRNKELYRLLESLKTQTCTDFEVIIVDQNEQNILSQIDYKLKYNITACVVKPPELLCASAARNLGVKFARAEYLGFPDDDCWYKNNTLQMVETIFLENNEIDMVSGIGKDPDNGGLSNSRFLAREKVVAKRYEIFKAGIEYSFFIKTSVFNFVNGFDESISTGSNSIFQSGESADLFFKVLECRKKIFFTPSLIIYHPYKNYFLDTESTALSDWSKIKNKQYGYAAGFGYVLKKHKCYLLFSYYIIRSIGALIISLFTFNSNKIGMQWSNLKGRIAGFLYNSKCI